MTCDRARARREHVRRNQRLPWTVRRPVAVSRHGHRSVVPQGLKHAERREKQDRPTGTGEPVLFWTGLIGQAVKARSQITVGSGLFINYKARYPMERDALPRLHVATVGVSRPVA